MTESNVDHIVIYRDNGQQWRWRALAGNGEIVSEGEAHTRQSDAARAAIGVFGHEVLIVKENHEPA